MKPLIALFVLSLSAFGAAAVHSDFAVDVKSHSTARIGFNTDSVITSWNVEWGTSTGAPYANATGYRSDETATPWIVLTAGNPTSVYVSYGHSCLNGYHIVVSGATGGWSSLNGLRHCTYTDANHFTVDADTTGATGSTWGTARYLRWEQALAGLPAGTTIYYRVCDTSGANCSAEQTFATDAEPGSKYPDPTAPTASGALSAVPTSFARTEATVTSCGSFQTAITTALARGETGNVLLPVQKGLHCTLSSNPGLSIGANTNTGYVVIRPDPATTNLPPDGVRISTDWEAEMFTLTSDTFGSQRTLLQLTSTNRIYLLGIIFENEFPTAHVKTITGATAATPIVYTATSHGYSNNDILQIREVGGVTGANITNCKVQNQTTHTFECKGSVGGGTYTSGGYAVKTPPLAPHALTGSVVSNITIDRCIVRNVWPATGYAGAIGISGAEGNSGARSTDINLINSYVYNVNDWVPIDPDTGARAACCSNDPYEGMIIIAADRVLIQNNKLDIPGISVFDDGGRITDLTFRRNLNDWNTAWKYSSSATNWQTTVRQQFEMKSCFRCKVDGNQFLNQWWGGPGQGTGAYNVPILFSGRSRADGFTGEYGFSDLTITNNLISNSTGGINIGNAGESQYDQKAIRNVLIRNNLMYGISRANGDASMTETWYGSATFLVLGGPFENLRIENNTMWDNRVWTGSGNRAIAFSGAPRGAYFRMKDNFWAHNNDGSTNISWSDSGSGVLPAADSTPNTDSITSKFLHDIDFSGNIVVPGVTDSLLEANYSDAGHNYSQATCATYWAGRSGVTCHGTTETTAYGRFATVGFTDYTTGNFRQTTYSGVGIDQDTLDNSIGKVKSVSVSGVSDVAATINYTAPDTDACAVEYSTSATWGTGSRTSDGGGAHARNVPLSSLSPSTTYNYRVLCSAEQPSGAFETSESSVTGYGIKGSVTIKGSISIK